jgi:hypothetical protein
MGTSLDSKGDCLPETGEVTVFPDYSFPAVIDAVRKQITEVDVEGLEMGDKDLALVVHLAKYFDRKTAIALIGKMRALKREYDEGGDGYKTPFALRNIENPIERSFILSNISAFSSTHGCTGGCSWCMYDAFATKDLEVVPLDQKKHFFDEYSRTFEDVGGDELAQTAVGKLGFYMDTDPFDDPDLVELMRYVYSSVAVTPILSTVVPHRGMNNFKELTSLAARHEVIRELEKMLNEIDKLKVQAKKLGIHDLEHLSFLNFEAQRFNALERFILLCESTETLDSGTKRLVFEANKDVFGPVLDFFKRGALDDYIEFEAGALEELKSFALLVEEKIKLFEDFRSKVTEFRLAFAASYEGAGFGRVEKFDFLKDASLSGVRSFCDEEKEALEGEPDIGEIRVSYVSHREKALSSMLSDGGNYRFALHGRDSTILHIEDSTRLGGKDFFDSGKEDGGGGIACNHSMKLTPYGLFNVLAGVITHDYPQGRIMVPYEGLVVDGVVAEEGSDISKVLQQTVVIFQKYFKSGNGPDYIYVYDGSKRVRKITFNLHTFKVVSDEIVRENIDSIEQILDLKEAVLGKVE